MSYGDELPLALIVFAYNEESNVPTVLPSILKWLRQREGEYQLIFVDDGSTDATKRCAEEAIAGDINCMVVSRSNNGGIGAALKTGVAVAKHKWITFLPCDGQIPVEELRILTAARAHENVSVVFSVYESRNDGMHRKVLSAGVRALIFAVHGVVMRSDGPYLFARELFDINLLKPDTFFLNFEFPIRILRAKIPYATVTIRCVPRISGHSKSTGWKRIVGVGRDLIDLRVRLAKE